MSRKNDFDLFTVTYALTGTSVVQGFILLQSSKIDFIAKLHVSVDTGLKVRKNQLLIDLVSNDFRFPAPSIYCESLGTESEYKEWYWPFFRLFFLFSILWIDLNY